MAGQATAERTVFLSTLPASVATATAGDIGRAGLVGHVPAGRAVAQVKLAEVWAFIPSYQSALFVPAT